MSIDQKFAKIKQKICAFCRLQFFKKYVIINYKVKGDTKNKNKKN